MAILITGGSGYIGSHTCLEMLTAGYDIVVLDNYCNSKPEVIRRVQTLSGKTFPVYEGDVRDKACLQKVFSEQSIDAVIHFAGLKAVGESTQKPLMYYDNNVTGTLVLCEVMAEHGCKRLIFSSSATVYNADLPSPRTEDMPTGAVSNPYGRTKLYIEETIRDVALAHPGGPGMVGGAAAVFQPHRRARKRSAGRRPARHSQQPDAVHFAGRHRQTRAAVGVRR